LIGSDADRLVPEKLQDALSVRCVPQVHGAAWDVLSQESAVIETELNSITDNPLLIAQGVDGLVVLPHGNGHGAPIALAADILALAVATVSNISQARSDRLTDTHRSGLPPFLAIGAADDPGLMIPPYSAAALTAENRGLAVPASVESISTCAGQEDSVSQGVNAARQLLESVENAEHIVAVELLCSAQAIDLKGDQLPSALGPVYRLVRDHVGMYRSDHSVSEDIENLAVLVKNGELSAAMTQGIS
jgi:histidine ammonia-lyase